MPASIDDRLQVWATDIEDHTNDFAEAVQAGLAASPKTLPCRFLYDEEGSKLFEEITRQPEYYPTEAERAILREQSDDIATHVTNHSALVELGSGNSDKTRLIIEAMIRAWGKLHYVPVDISREIMEHNANELLATHDQLQITAIAAEYNRGLDLIEREIEGPKCIAWLGSSMGNMTHEAAVAFLEQIRKCMHEQDTLLVGVDLLKDPAILQPAYDDAAGVSAAFNLNMLTRINRDLDGDFNVNDWSHRATFNPDLGRMEMFLVSTREQKARIKALDMEVSFAAGEVIHTENSHKFTKSQIETIGRETGLELEHQWFDPKQLFSLNVFQPA